jgi:hypothetical protein
MPVGEIILVAYGDENNVLNYEPQISFFKIIYRRYTNFAMESVRTNFIYQPKFGKRFSCELSKFGDLINKMWLIIDLPDLPILYTYENNLDNKLKFAWARDIGYVIIDYVEIEIGGKVIQKKWGEYMNAVDKVLNYKNYNSSLDPYIGNLPEYYEYQYTKNGIPSRQLKIPLTFWFCETSGMSLPLLCLEHNIVRFNVQLKDFNNCGIFSPSNYVEVVKYFGNGILGEPLVQYSQQGVAWAEFDSIDVANYDNATLNILSYNLYYRKISDNSFITTTNDYFNSFLENINSTLFDAKNPKNYFIYGLKSGSIYVPISSSTDNPNTTFIEKIYKINFLNDISFKDMYLLSSYVFLDREERKRFYDNRHEYIIEQITFSGNQSLINLNNTIYVELVNPCKWVLFMAQISYLTNPNVNDWFNYKTSFIRDIDGNINGKSVIKNVSFNLNSSQISDSYEMEVYNYLLPFEKFKMSNVPAGFGIFSFSLYPNNLQPSGSCNMSVFNTFSINATFNPIDITYNNYKFKTYSITYNNLVIVHGLAGVMFNTNI